MRDSDEIWQLLSAYADGELDVANSADIKARLRAEPDLRQELDRIRTLKCQLGTLRPPEVAAGASGRRKNHIWSRSFTGAAAAAVVVVAVGIGAMLVWPSAQSTWLDKAIVIHDELSQATYVVDEAHVTRIVSSGQALGFRAPDLTASRLYLVDVVASPSDDTEAIAMHYRGMRGCRLTVVATPITSSLGAPLAADGLLHTWTYGGFNFAVVAKGMDEQRFATVAPYVEAAIVDGMRQHDELMIAMTEGYDAARPCA